MEFLLEFAQGQAGLVTNAVKALLVLVVGWTLAGLVSRLIRRKVLSSESLDDTIGSFIASIARWVILLIVAVAVLGIFGIEATSLVAILGAATLAIGMALQGTLSDLAAGFMLIIFRPYKLGQFVDIAGSAGTVKDINLFVTELATADNVQIIVPNGQAWGAVITNFSHHATRRCDLVFGIDYGDDIEKAKSIILNLANNDARVMSDPEPWVRVTNLGDSSVDITARLWCSAEDFWELKFGMTQAVKEAFDKDGISIPYPHTVEIKREA
ncbi:mechanosensitive ion channel family protein [Cognatishimia activa]|uniref:mechanosensitive ion channel family protein n=1 Tax=Cognatishimia activa TaxID=1715691 RepID=UPI00222EEE3B|nr:mechanosensitive ion channel domain-containing protein [Cognatishimia activa]UZD90280.1 mechanosensitive ion channel [Cognatishimia activa]